MSNRPDSVVDVLRGTMMRDLWIQVHELFDTDDGSLPDILVGNLTSDQVVTIYRWVRSQCEIYSNNGDATVWHREHDCDVSIKSLDNPALLATSGRVEPFRHGLTRFTVSGVAIPQLTIEVSANEIGFDYRMGSDWGPSQVTALFDFLWSIQQLAPAATISHSHEGDSKPTQSFANAWREFKYEKRAGQ